MQHKLFASFVIIFLIIAKPHKALSSDEVNCDSFHTCTSCMGEKSGSHCNWCLDGHRCTQDTKSCPYDLIITDSNQNCPRIDVAENESEILVPAGENKTIKVKVHFPGFIAQSRFNCQFNIEGKVITSRGLFLADTIYCDDIEFQFKSESPTLKVPFAVIFGESKPLDNPNNVHIVIYRCTDMAKSCENCLAMAEKYKCGWCSPRNTLN